MSEVIKKDEDKPKYPGVTVLTVNGGLLNLKWLKECRDSVFAQKTKYQILHTIIDNILNRKTYSQALNEGIRQSPFPFIFVLDSDDVIHEEAIEMMMDNFLEIKNKVDRKYAALGCNELLINEESNPIGMLRTPHLCLLDKELILACGGIPEVSWREYNSPFAVPIGSLLARRILDRELKFDCLESTIYAKRIHRGQMSFLTKQELYEEILYNAEIGKHLKSGGGVVEYSDEYHNPGQMDRSQKKVMIGIVTYNNQNTISYCLKKIFWSTDKAPDNDVEIMVVDNNSTDKTVKILDGIRIPNIRMKENTGFAAGCNELIRIAIREKNTHLILLNPDVYVIPYWLESVLACEERHRDKNCGIVGVEELDVIGRPTHNLVACDKNIKEFDKVRNVALSWEKMGIVPREIEVPAVTFSCAMITRKVFEKIIFDEKFGLGYFEDVDFCLLAAKMGFSIWSTPYAKVIHHKHVSWLSHDDSKVTEIFKRNYDYLVSKWGDPPVEDMSEWVKRNGGS